MGLYKPVKWPAPSTYTTGGLRDWSEQEEEVNGSFGSPHHGNREAAATMPQKHRTLCGIDCLHISINAMSDGTKICRVACANLRGPNNYYQLRRFSPSESLGILRPRRPKLRVADLAVLVEPLLVVRRALREQIGVLHRRNGYCPR